LNQLAGQSKRERNIINMFIPTLTTLFLLADISLKRYPMVCLKVVKKGKVKKREGPPPLWGGALIDEFKIHDYEED